MTTWTILIATVGQRRSRFERLLTGLLAQTEPYDGNVTVCAYYNHGEQLLGCVRQALLEHATSDYVSFVDDDDELPDYHVARVMACLDADVDYVGWRMQTYVDKRKLLPTFHSLKNPPYAVRRHGHYRDVSHLNPIRRQLALLGDFRRGDPPEDMSWADQVRGHAKTECYIDDIMYFYHSSSTDTLWRPNRVMSRDRPRRTPIHHENFSYHPASAL